ncbi:penicillin-binding protein [Kribbella antibiotica]|uniref:Penicillin-binding protein n=1 Tax=Kribbella antibiotica TaxID=190195 RepID=A0A4R4ZYH8_9ACTN|nr:transglycosylase domain-containing protein [Kribbella antibiotica]TDD63416.1 penicillin-binding protein [Kribbella antibiotica]
MRRPATRTRRWFRRIAGWLLGSFFVVVIGAVVAFFVGYARTGVPDANEKFEANTTVVTYADGKTQVGSFFQQNRKSVPLAQIPKHVQDAVIAAEDRSFWTNPGVSFPGMGRAAFAIARGKQLQGGSTITQQYVKVMYLNQERTMSRKLDELFIATKISRTRDKEWVLGNYLNTIYFGEGAYGVRAAGQVYFGVDHPKDLTVPQAAYLATVLNNPTRFDSDDPAAAERILGRYQYVVNGMAEMGTITPAQSAQYRKALPVLHKKPKSNRYAGPSGFLLEMTRRELAKYGFEGDRLSGGGLRVVTTFDHQLQAKAVAAVRDVPIRGLQIGLASVRPATGEVAAVVGGADFLKSQLNWATTKAPPGALLRPFAIPAGLADRSGAFEVPSSEGSLNRAFFQLVDSKRGPLIAAAAEAAGIPRIPPTDRQAPGLGPDALASPLDLASAYGVFAADGRKVTPHVIKEVRDAHGKLLWSAATQKGLEPAQVYPAAAAILTAKLVGGSKATTVNGLSIEKRKANLKCRCRANKGLQPLASWHVGYSSDLSTAIVYRAGKQGESALPLDNTKEGPTLTWFRYLGGLAVPALR